MLTSGTSMADTATRRKVVGVRLFARRQHAAHLRDDELAVAVDSILDAPADLRYLPIVYLAPKGVDVVDDRAGIGYV